MKRLPESQDDKGTPLTQAMRFLLVPAVVLLAFPLAILIALAIYLAAILQGIKVLVCVVLGKPPPQPLPKPNFLERQSPAMELPTAPKKG